jgi:hypothetical protein
LFDSRAFGRFVLLRSFRLLQILLEPLDPASQGVSFIAISHTPRSSMKSVSWKGM